MWSFALCLQLPGWQHREASHGGVAGVAPLRGGEALHDDRALADEHRVERLPAVQRRLHTTIHLLEGV